MVKFVKKSNGSVTVIGHGKNGKGSIVGNLPKISAPKDAPESLPTLPNEMYNNLQKVEDANNDQPQYHPSIVSVAEEIARRNTDVLDIHQVRNLLFYGGKSEGFRKSRKSPSVDAKQWNDFLDSVLLTAENPSKGEPLTGEDLVKFEEEIKLLKRTYNSLGEEEKHNLMKLAQRIRHARYALEREYVYVALCNKPSPSNEEVKTLVDYHRQYFYSLPENLRPKVPQHYKSAFYRNAFGLPKDPGTVYAFYKTETTKFHEGSYDAGAVFVAFDTETSSINPQDGEILQLGYGIYNSEGELLEKASYYVKPERMTEDGKHYTGPEGAFKVHGITSEMVSGAESFPEVWNRIAPKLQGSVVIGHNVNFDLRHLREQFKVHKLVNAEGKSLSTSDVWWGEVDTLKYAQRHIPDSKNHKLTTLSETYGISLENAHDAGDDAVASGDLFFKIRSNKN